jgi:GntR family transcriptional regulator
MSTPIHIDPQLPVPIWSQIEEAVRRQVALGQLRSGEAIPSVRELAQRLRVNPATVSKAYQRLVDQGLLEVRRGEGTFVAEAPPPMARSERAKTLRAAAERYAMQGLTLGASAKEAHDELTTAWDRTTKARGGER